jgi:hypothetical protein
MCLQLVVTITASSILGQTESPLSFRKSCSKFEDLLLGFFSKDAVYPGNNRTKGMTMTSKAGSDLYR